MKHIIYKPLKRRSARANGTSLQCYAKFTFDDIVDAFGDPLHPADTYKTSAEWHIEVSRDADLLGVVTIYDYKEHKGYRSSGKDTQDITEWHVGAKSKHVAATVIDYIQTNKSYNDPIS
jgi:hypothetical protein